MLIAKAPSLTVLLSFRDAAGVMRFPVEAGSPYPGIPCPLDHSLAISKLAILKLEKFLGRDDLSDKVEVVAAIEPVLKAEGHEPSLLYLLRPKADLGPVDPSWPRITDILRQLPQGGNRVAYNKALQYLAGAAEADISVLEADGEVKARLQELARQSPESLLE